jgi:hypothetical protein
MNWINLAQDRDWWKALVNTVMNSPFLYNAGMFLSRCMTGSQTTTLKFINKLCENCLTYCAQDMWQLIRMGIPVLFQCILCYKGLITSPAVKHLIPAVVLHMLPILLL